MREILKVGVKLLLITAVAGLVLGLTNAVTAGPIEQQSIASAQAARQAVLPAAATFEEVEAPEGMDAIYKGLDASGTVVGYTGTITTRGYGGLIEITVGTDMDGVITGVSIGGSDFSETAGLGARVKEAWFGEQFVGKTSPLALTKNGGEIDAVTSATISSTAVTTAIDTACQALAAEAGR